MSGTFQKTSNNCKYRVVYKDSSIVIAHDISDLENASLRIMDEADFRRMIRSGELKEIDDPNLGENYLNKWVTATPEMKEKAEEDYRLVDTFLKEAGFDVYDLKKRPKLIKMFVEKTGMPSVKTFKRMLSRFFSNGMDIPAMLKNYPTGKNRKKRVYRNKPGPKTANMMAPADYEEPVKRYLTKNYSDSRAPSLETVRKEMNHDLFTDSNGDLQLNRPSYQAIRRIAKTMDQKKVITDRTSEPFYFNNYMPVRDNARSDVLFPYDRVEFDCTILPIYLVSKLNRSVCVGKPVLILIVDAATRMILGMHVTLENASYENGIKEAILNMLRPKDRYAEEFGVTISFDDWPVEYYLPRSGLGDKGEAFNHLSDSLPGGTDMELKNAVSFKAKQKPVVENLFNDFTRYVKEKFPGAVLEHLSERERRDYRKEAKLTLEDLTAELIDFVVTLNKKTVRYPVIPEPCLTEGVECTPLALFNYGVQFQMGSLKIGDPEKLKYRLLPQKEMTLTRAGIRYKGLRYVHSNPETENWIVNKLDGKRSVKVEVLYSAQDLSQIFVLNNGDMIPFRIDTTQEYLSEITLEEYLVLLENYKERLKRTVLEDDKLFNELIGRYRRRLKNIEDKSGEGPAEVNNITVNRHVEKMMEKEPVFADFVDDLLSEDSEAHEFAPDLVDDLFDSYFGDDS